MEGRRGQGKRSERSIMKIRPGDGIGRHKGLKIPRSLSVPVQVRPWVPKTTKKPLFQGVFLCPNFYFSTRLPAL